MAAFNDKKFTDVLTSQASGFLGVPQAAIPTDWISLLLSLITGIFGGCLNNPTPTPTSSTDAAAQIKGANFIQRGVMHGRIVRHFRQHDFDKKKSRAAGDTVLASVDATSVADLAQAIDDAKEDAKSVPDVDLF